MARLFHGHGRKAGKSKRHQEKELKPISAGKSLALFVPCHESTTDTPMLGALAILGVGSQSRMRTGNRKELEEEEQ